MATPAGPAPVVDTAFANAFPRLRLTNGVNLRLPVGNGQRFLPRMNRVADAIIGGWEASYILSANSGLPLNISLAATGTDPATGKAYTFLSSQGGGTIRPNRVGDPKTGIGASQDRLRYLDSAAFQLQTLNTPGNAARNSSWGPGLLNVDLTLSKKFKINERQHLDLRLEGFNALNHTNYSAPNAVWGGTTFGQITTAGANRVVQMGIKYSF